MFIQYGLACLLLILNLAGAGWGKEPVIIEARSTTLIYPSYWHTPFGIHRATQNHLIRFTQQATRFDQPQGMACLPLLKNNSTDNQVAPFQITVIGVNQGQANLIYNPSLFNIAILSSNEQFTLLQPVDVAANQNHPVYVSDRQSKQVHYFMPQNGQLTWQGQLTPPPQGWLQPTALALDPDGQCYIADEQAHRIYHYNASQQYIKTIGPQVSDRIVLFRPQAIAVTSEKEPWSYYRHNALYILDQNGQRLINLSLQGEVQHSLTAEQLGASTTAFAWMALDYYDQVWVTAPEEGCVYKFDHQLAFLAKVGHPGEGDYFFNYPTGITIHRHFGQVFVAEKNAVHYFWIGADLGESRLTLSKDRQQLKLSFFLTEPALVSLKTTHHRQSQQLYRRYRLSSGHQQLQWHEPRTIDPAHYHAELLVEATYSTRSHFGKKIKVGIKQVK